MKRYLKYSLIVFLLLIVIPVLIFFGVIFVKPLIVLNPHVLAWGLHKSGVLESWSWKQARFSHERKNLFHRNFEGEFQDFCIRYNKPALRYETCFEKIAWDIDVLMSFKKGIFAKTISPLAVNSSFTNVISEKIPEPPESSSPPNLKKYWNLLWHPLIPDMDFDFQNISIKTEKKFPELFVTLRKREHDLRINVPDFLITADPNRFIIASVKDIPLSKFIKKKTNFSLSDLKLVGSVVKKGVILDLTGEMNSIRFFIDSFLSLPLKGEFTSAPFLKDFLLQTTGEVRFMDVKENLGKLAPAPYNELPAPFSILNGNVIAHLEVRNKSMNEVYFLIDTGIRLKSRDQVVDVDIGAELPFHLNDYSMGIVNLGIDFNHLKINLPSFSKKALAPQMKPDSRFKTHAERVHPKEKNSVPFMLNLTAKNEKSLTIESNLLDEVLRLNLDLHIDDGGISNGYVKVLPLKTTILKRKINLRSLVVKFDAPLSPVIKAFVQFPLPEYKIAMELEGPISEPRYAFSSEPPLPESDIFAVLIYGRPMEDLDASDKSSASASTQILSQGVLSLTTLYLLSGTPIEYVGYDEEKKSAFAQIGLGSKGSLRIGGGKEGVNSTDIRRSLGKGWFLDTSVQNTNTGVNSDKDQDFGVMLERIIAY